MQDQIKGLRVIVVEDDAAIMMLAEDMLQELGCVIAGTATRMNEALASAQSCAFDVALLDVNLAGQPVYPVADIVQARGLPIVFCTGYGGESLEEAWRSTPVLQKPYRMEHLSEVLARAAGRT
ncbi:MAG: response regulator [Pseudorhodoplanes sp.]